MLSVLQFVGTVSSPPIVLAEFDWNQVFVILVPLLYFAAQFFGGKKEKDDKPAPSKGGQDGKSAGEAAQERLRRVQEEIRRKIAERQEAMRGGESESAEDSEHAGPPPVPTPRRGYDPNVPEWAQRRSSAESARAPSRSESSRSSRPTPPPVPVESGASEGGESSLDRQLREQRERLARAKREREAAFAKTAGALSEARSWEISTSQERARGSSRRALLEGLSSPAAAREAILLREVLGPPRALQEFGAER